MLFCFILSTLSAGNVYDASQCNSLATKWLQQNQKTPRRAMQVGAWYWVPYGCSVQSGGDWAIHWNTARDGVDSTPAYYTLIASGPSVVEYMDGLLTEPRTMFDCALWGDVFLKSVAFEQAKRPMQFGSWDWVPYGCSVQTAGDWTVHLCINENGTDTDEMYSKLMPGKNPLLPRSRSLNERCALSV